MGRTTQKSASRWLIFTNVNVILLFKGQGGRKQECWQEEKLKEVISERAVFFFLTSRWDIKNKNFLIHGLVHNWNYGMRLLGNKGLMWYFVYLLHDVLFPIYKLWHLFHKQGLVVSVMLTAGGQAELYILCYFIYFSLLPGLLTAIDCLKAAHIKQILKYQSMNYNENSHRKEIKY